MSGFLLDTNTLIYAINQGLQLSPNTHHLSVITEMELLSYHLLSHQEKDKLKQLLVFFNIG